MGGAAISCGRPSPRCAMLMKVLRMYLPRNNHAGRCVAKRMSPKPRRDTSEHKQHVSASAIPQYQRHFIVTSAYTCRSRTQGTNKYTVVEELTQGSVVQAMDEVVQNLRAPRLRHDLAADLGVPGRELLRRREGGRCNETNILFILRFYLLPGRFRKHL